MKYILLLLSFAFFISCKKEEIKPVNLSGSSLKKTSKVEEYDFTNGQTASMSADEFADLKKQKDDEECTDEEKIEKKLLEKKKAFKLQGETEEDCAVQ
tara:strand:+ start:2612 stop:2905 length:294 start_codon:yes stop_codon:yes gene_type:complete